jgi:hypothetical protein
MKSAYGTEQKGIHAAVRFPAPESAVDARVVNFRTTHLILIDRQFLSLAPQIKHFQDVVENLATGSFGAGPRHPCVRCIDLADAVETARNSRLWKSGYPQDGTHPTKAMVLCADEKSQIQLVFRFVGCLPSSV